MKSLRINWFLCVSILTALISLHQIESLPSGDGSPVQSDGSVRRLSLTKTPQNIAAIVGDTVILECMVKRIPENSKVMWWEYASKPKGAQISDGDSINNIHPSAGRYSVIHTSPTDYSLVIQKLKLNDGGKYRCSQNLSADQVMGEAEIIVLESAPVCISSMLDNGVVLEGQKHTTECSVHYQGKYAPTMTWSGPQPFKPSQPSTDSGVVKYGIEFTVDRSMDWKVYTCKTNFMDIGKVADNAADNTPTWQTVYATTPLFVYWGPKNLYVEPIKSRYSVGDILTCYADSYPPAFYQWLNTRTNEYVNAQLFTITESLAKTNQTLRCMAQNFIAGTIYTTDVFVNVNVPKKNV